MKKLILALSLLVAGCTTAIDGGNAATSKRTATTQESVTKQLNSKSVITKNESGTSILDLVNEATIEGNKLVLKFRKTTTEVHPTTTYSTTQTAEKEYIFTETSASVADTSKQEPTYTSPSGQTGTISIGGLKIQNLENQGWIRLTFAVILAAAAVGWVWWRGTAGVVGAVGLATLSVFVLLANGVLLVVGLAAGMVFCAVPYFKEVASGQLWYKGLKQTVAGVKDYASDMTPPEKEELKTSLKTTQDKDVQTIIPTLK